MMHPIRRRHGSRSPRHYRVHGTVCALLGLLLAAPHANADSADEQDAGHAAAADALAASTKQSVAVGANLPVDVATMDVTQARPSRDTPGNDPRSRDANGPDVDAPTSREGPESLRRSGVEFIKHRAPRRVAWFRTGLGALALVLVLIGGLTWALKRWLPSARRVENSALRVVGRASLTPKHSVALLQVGQRFVVVGLGGDTISALCEIENPEEVAFLAVRTGTSLHAHGDSHAEFEAFLRGEAANYKADKIDFRDRPGRARLDRPEGGPLKELLGKLRAVCQAAPASSQTES